MLSLIRSRTTCQHSIKHARAALSIAEARFSSTRYAADNQGLGFGSLSVPIPIDSKNRIAFKAKSAHKPQAQVTGPKEPGGEVSEKERGRRNLRNRRTHERAKLRRLRFQAKQKELASESTSTTKSEGEAEVRASTSQEEQAGRYAEEEAQEQDQEDGLSSISARFEELDKSEEGTKTNTKGKGTGRRDGRGARPSTSSQKSGNVPNTDFAPEEIEGMSGTSVVGSHADPM